MKMWQYLTTGLSALVITVAGLSGCSDDGGSSSTSTGIFIDAPVAGINYRCGTATATTGTTTATGQYTCPTGQAVAFYVGDIEVGSIPTTLARTTPLDLVGAGSSVDSDEVLNIAIFLMSISSTDPTVNGGVITIPASVHTAATGLSVNFAFLSSALNAVSSIAPAGSRQFSALEARAHLTSSLNNLFAGSYSGTYSGLSSGTWQLTIDNSGLVLGTYTPTGGVTGTLNGSMSPELTTGGRYAFDGGASNGIWSGYLDVNTGAFNGIWTSGGGQDDGTYTGRKL